MLRTILRVTEALAISKRRGPWAEAYEILIRVAVEARDPDAALAALEAGAYTRSLYSSI